MNVDEFVNSKVQPELREVVEVIRTTMKELAPEAQEIISYGIPAYRRKKIIAVISPTKVDITLTFSRGAEFEDQYARLKGVGKVSKHLKFKHVGEVDKELIGYYVRQALEFDER